MIFLTAMIIWGFLSIFLMISSILFGFFQNWYVFVYLGVYFLLIVLGLLDVIKVDKECNFISDEKGVKY